MVGRFSCSWIRKFSRCPELETAAASARRPALVMLAVMASMLAPTAADSAEFLVKPETKIDADGVCSLLEALDNAEQDAQVHADCPAGSSGGDRLVLESGYDYAFDAPWPGFPNGAPFLTGDLEILGNGATIRRSSKAPDFRLFEIGNGTFEFSDLTLSNGASSGPMDGGGAIRASGADLTLRRVTLRNNHAEGLFALGGAIRKDATTLLIEDSLIDNNSALASSQNLGGGAIAQFGGELTIRRSALLDNRADLPCDDSNPDNFLSTGGAIRIEALDSDGAVINIEDSTLAGNIGRNGGAIAIVSVDSPVSGIEDVFVQILRSTLAFNRIGACGAGLGDAIDVNKNNGGTALVTYAGTILLGNGRTDPLGNFIGDDCSSTSVTGDFLSLDSNIVDPSGRCDFDPNTDIARTDIATVVDPLRSDNAYTPRASGPAVDLTEVGVWCPEGTDDQLGNPRADGAGMGGSRCDAGAVEFQPVGSRFTLNVTTDGSGSGSVISAPAGIGCAPDCTADFDDGTVVTLTAQPAADNTFTGWSGDCSGTGPCTVTMDQTRNVIATFDGPSTFELTLGVLGGEGTVTSDPAGIDCSLNQICRFDFPAGTLVELTQQAQPGFVFDQWSFGPCIGLDTCTVLMDQDRNFTALFSDQAPIRVIIEGSGSVVSTPAGIDCASSCTGEFDVGETVELSPAQAAGEVFLGWFGDCSGTSRCTVVADGDREVTARFTDGVLDLARLSVEVNGAGGSVRSTPLGIDCPDDCSEEWPVRTEVELIATADPGFEFEGWRGDCSGSGSCVVNLEASRSVIADFAALYTLDVTVDGDGSVTSLPLGIDCPGSCSEEFIEGEKVLLTPTPQPGSEFVGWSGACSGTGTCLVSIDQDRQVTAAFAASGFELQIVLEGEGSGQVTDLAGLGAVDCPGTCSAVYPVDSMVMLEALENPDSSFQGFGGDCQGTSCTVTMDRNRRVRAVFLSDDQLFIDSFE